jgi:hypothetical protein
MATNYILSSLGYEKPNEHMFNREILKPNDRKNTTNTISLHIFSQISRFLYQNTKNYDVSSSNHWKTEA